MRTGKQGYKVRVKAEIAEIVSCVLRFTLMCWKAKREGKFPVIRRCREAGRKSCLHRNQWHTAIDCHET